MDIYYTDNLDGVRVKNGSASGVKLIGMDSVVIQPPSEGKGRSFKALLAAYVRADTLWESGVNSDNIRPVWAAFAGSENELRPFVANLQMGRKAEIDNQRRSKVRFEILRSAGYQFAWQRTPVGSLVTVYLPELFDLDPGMVDPKGIQFCILPAKSWLKAPDPSALEHLAKLGADLTSPKVQHLASLAPLFMTYLDRRTRAPLIPDIRFYAQILYQALELSIVSWSTHASTYWRSQPGYNISFCFEEVQIEELGYVPGVAMKTTHDTLEKFLAAEVTRFFEVTRG